MASIELRSRDLDFLLKLVLDPNGLRDTSGAGNNLANPDYGAGNTPLVRLAPNAYGDGISTPRSLASDGTQLPNERDVSNLISDQDENKDGIEESMPNSAGYNLLLTAFGQFFDHGLDFIKRGTETYTIPLAPSDILYNADPSKGPIVTSISLSRGAEVVGTGTGSTAREHHNEPSAYVDQSQTYGSHKAITYYLRESARDANGNLIRNADGLLEKTAHLLSGGNDTAGRENLATYRDILLNNGVAQSTINLAIAQNNFQILEEDVNFVAFDNTADPLTGSSSGHSLLIDISFDADPNLAGGRFFKVDALLSHYVAGDGRVNENISLTPIHTIWHREHDYQVDRITEMVAQRKDAALWTSDVIFEAAKIINEAEYQRVVYTEFLDAMAGGINGSGSHGAGGYDPNVNASISEEFAHAVYRVGHSMVNESVAFTDAAGETYYTSLINAYLNPTAYAVTGVDSLIAGSIETLHERIDENLVNAVRNQLVGQPLDLGAINIARGREVGVMSLNDFRRYLYENGTLLGSTGSDFTQDAKGDSSLRPYNSWNDFAANLRDPSLVDLFKQVYHSVDDVDLWIGGLAEKPAEGQLGSTFAFVFREQLDRLQDGDRFYYFDRLDGSNLLSDIKNQEFADIIMRNSGLTGLSDVFKATDLSATNVAIASFIQSFSGDHGANTLDGTAGADLMQGNGGDDELVAGGGDDRLMGGDGDDALLGGTGSDTLDGGSGIDRMAGGASDDIYYVDNVSDHVMEQAEAGIDVVSSTVSFTIGDNVENLALTGVTAVTGTGNALANILSGNAAANVLSGEAGSDTLFGGTGSDTLRGDAGDDVLQGGLGKDLLLGGEGADRFVIIAADETQPNAAGRDVIGDWGVGDLIDLSGMDASLDLAGMQDFVFRGTAADPFKAAAGELWTYQFGGNTYLVGGVNGDNARNFQIELTGLHSLSASQILGARSLHLAGTSGSDMLTGSAGHETLEGMAGDDVLQGGLGKDLLLGGEGADRFVFTSAAETQPNAAGRDVIGDWGMGDLIDLSAVDANLDLAGMQDFVFRGTAADPFKAAAGELWTYQFGGNTYLVGGVNGGTARDFQIELAGLHSLSASQILGAGRVNLAGSGGSDMLTGTAGDDTLQGVAGNDTLQGLAGDDVLQGGLGKDLLLGGHGADRFVFTAAAEMRPNAAGRDVIGDWGVGDLIDLSGMDANLDLAGMQDFTFRGTTADPFMARAGELWTYQFGGNTYLIGGVNGDTARDFQIELTGLHSLTADQILV